MIHTTLNKIREHRPCEKGWKKLLSFLGKTSADDEPLPLLKILESNGLDDTLWCLRSVPEHDKEWRLFAVWCARRVQYLMNDARSIVAIDMAEKYACDQATDEELVAAGAAARAAARAASGAAARAAARAASGAAARAASGAASGAASWAASRAAARAASGAASRAAERNIQQMELIRIIGGE